MCDNETERVALNIFSHTVSKYVCITIQQRTIVSTLTQLFYKSENRNWVAASNIKVGDKLLDV